MKREHNYIQWIREHPHILFQYMAAGSVVDEEAVFHLNSTIRGHHVYKTIWTPTIGEVLLVVREPSNPMIVMQWPY